MIHRVVYGSIERFIGILIEHYAGAFPAWLAPTQVRILNITDNQKEYAHQIAEKMDALGLRVWVDDRNEKLGYKIREAQVKKVPYTLVVGDAEMENGQVNVRQRGVQAQTTMSVDEFIAKLQADIAAKQ